MGKTRRALKAHKRGTSDTKKVQRRKGKTILDYAGTLPDMGLTIEEMREKAVREAAKDHG